MGPASPWTELQQWVWWLSGLGGNNQTRARQTKKLDESWTCWCQGGGVYHLIMPGSGFSLSAFHDSPFFFLTFLWISLSCLILLLPLLFSQYLQALLQFRPVIPPFRVIGGKGQSSSLAYKRDVCISLFSSLLFYSCFVDKSQGAPHVSQISLNLNLNLSLYER